MSIGVLLDLLGLLLASAFLWVIWPPLVLALSAVTCLFVSWRRSMAA